MRSLIILLLLGWSLQCHAQWYKCLPVKINHQWGLIDQNGEVILEPQFDALGAESFKAIQQPRGYSNRYVKASAGDSLGLLDWKGKVILSPKYQDVIPLTDSVFCVREEEGFRVMNQHEEYLVTDFFDKIRIPNSQTYNPKNAYFTVTKDSLLSVWKKGKGLLFPAKQYLFLDVLKKEETTAIVVQKKEDTNRFVLNDRGEQIIAQGFTDFKLIAPNLILAKDEEQIWEVYDTTGNLVIPEGFFAYRRLNSRFYAFAKENGVFNHIFNTQTLKFLDLPFEEFYPISENYFCGPEGEIILPAQFKEILSFEGDERLIVLKEKWGIYDVPKDTFALALRYDKIVKVAKIIDEDFVTEMLENASEIHDEDHTIEESDYVLYQIEQKGLKGLINQDLDFVFEPKYDQLFLEFPLIKGFQGYAMDLLEINNQAKVIDTETYAKVYTVKVGHGFAQGLDATGMTINQMQNIAGPGRGRRSRAQLEYDAWEDGMEFFKNSPYGYFYDDEGKKMMAELKGNRVLIDSLRFNAIEHLPYTKLSLIYQTKHTTTGDFNEMNHKPIINHLWVAALFDHTTGELISDFEIVGVRAIDFVEGHAHAAVLFANSQFGLMDKQGNFNAFWRCE